jgi:rfaE bifunctional protein nucleotidyltransferase chain/domain
MASSGGSSAHENRRKISRVINWVSERNCVRKYDQRGASSGVPVLSLHEAILRFGREKRNGRRVVFTNGCFDLLHPGHIETLERARERGDLLIVGLNSDRSVREMKGAGRPILPAVERAEILAALECVDAVVIFDELTPQEIVSAISPDVLVKGGDWASDQIVGRREVEAAGGRVVSVPVVEGYSTSAIVEKIRRAGRF